MDNINNNSSEKSKSSQKQKAIFSVIKEDIKIEDKDHSLKTTFTEAPIRESTVINQTECIAFIHEKKSDFSLLGQEPWPDDVKLYQPYETEQILLPDMANCLAVQAFLKMCHLHFTIEYRANAENMSPSGRVPFIKCGACLVSDLEPITSFVGNKGISLTSELDAAQKSDMRAYMSLVNTVLGNAENYVTWVDDCTYSNVTKPRYGSVYPFPLNHILTYRKRQNIIKKLMAFGWYQKTVDKVYEEVDRGCSALSERLGDQKFFFGDRPTELDALIFGHVFAILMTPGFPAGVKLGKSIRGHKTLINLCHSVMDILHLSENITISRYHNLYLKQNNIKVCGDTGEPEIDEEDEFVYDSDDTEENSDLKKEAEEQNYASIVNEPNTIYDAVFGITPFGLELQALRN